MDLESMYLSGMSGIQIAKELNLPYHKIYYQLNKMGISRRSNKVNSRKYYVNDSIFEKIDTEFKAYWLGFMFADGFISKNNGQKNVGLTLGRIDKEHLEKFSKFLDSTYPIHDYSGITSYGYVEYSRVVVTSDKMFDDLSFLGCVEHKTKILDKPNISIEYVRHFVRGFIDGDGSITHGSNCVPKISCVGTKEMLIWVAEQFPEKANVNKHKMIFEWQTTSRKARKNIEWLYGNSNIYLTRKFRSAVKICPNIEDTKNM